MLIYKYDLQQENKTGKVKGGDSFQKKEVASTMKFPEMNLRKRLMTESVLVTLGKLSGGIRTENQTARS